MASIGTKSVAAESAEASAVETEASALYGDILDKILSKVPLIDLVSASHVSRTWFRSAAVSVDFLNPVKPWLLIHVHHHRRRAEHVLISHAYDPRSHVWVEIRREPGHGPGPEPGSAGIRSANSNFLYAISPSEFRFSSDPLHLKWTPAGPPRTWRAEPVVARVGSMVVVAGGGYDFEDDPMSVEMYDVSTGSWCDGCQSMPLSLKSSASATWLSAAADERRLLVTEKSSGATFAFSPSTKTWTGPYSLRPDPRAYFFATGFVGNRLIVIGLIGDSERCEGVRLWEFDAELVESRVVGDAPEEVLERLKGESFELNSISAVMGGDRIFVMRGGERAEVVVTCEIFGGGVRWGCVENRGVSGVDWTARIVPSCSTVKMADLKQAMLIKKCKFRVI